MNIKKFVTSTLFIFWAIVVAVLIVGLFFAGKSGLGSSVNTANTTPSNSSSSSNTSSGKQVVLNMTEISKHNNINDCWLLISGKVYDVTSFMNDHPSGSEAILRYCGKDATVGFDTKDQGKPHSSSAQSLLDSYYIGDFNKVSPKRN